MRKDSKEIKACKEVIVPADKTRNWYKVSEPNYRLDPPEPHDEIHEFTKKLWSFSSRTALTQAVEYVRIYMSNSATEPIPKSMSPTAS